MPRQAYCVPLSHMEQHMSSRGHTRSWTWWSLNTFEGVCTSAGHFCELSAASPSSCWSRRHRAKGVRPRLEEQAPLLFPGAIAERVASDVLLAGGHRPMFSRYVSWRQVVIDALVERGRPVGCDLVALWQRREYLARYAMDGLAINWRSGGCSLGHGCGLGACATCVSGLRGSRLFAGRGVR